MIYCDLRARRGFIILLIYVLMRKRFQPAENRRARRRHRWVIFSRGPARLFLGSFRMRVVKMAVAHLTLPLLAASPGRLSFANGN